MRESESKCEEENVAGSLKKRQKGPKTVRKKGRERERERKIKMIREGEKGHRVR